MKGLNLFQIKLCGAGLLALLSACTDQLPQEFVRLKADVSLENMPPVLNGNTNYRVNFNKTVSQLQVRRLQLQYAEDGKRFQDVIVLPGDSTAYPWQTPPVNRSNAQLKLIVTDIRDRTSETVSNAFEIQTTGSTVTVDDKFKLLGGYSTTGSYSIEFYGTCTEGKYVHIDFWPNDDYQQWLKINDHAKPFLVSQDRVEGLGSVTTPCVKGGSWKSTIHYSPPSQDLKSVDLTFFASLLDSRESSESLKDSHGKLIIDSGVWKWMAPPVPVSPIAPVVSSPITFSASCYLSSTDSKHRVRIEWGALPDTLPKETTYNLYRSQSQEVGYQKLNSSPLNPSASHEDSDIVNGTTYYYKMTFTNFNPFDPMIESGPSDAISITPSETGCNQMGIHLSWDSSDTQVPGRTFTLRRTALKAKKSEGCPSGFRPYISTDWLGYLRSELLCREDEEVLRNTTRTSYVDYIDRTQTTYEYALTIDGTQKKTIKAVHPSVAGDSIGSLDSSLVYLCSPSSGIVRECHSSSSGEKEKNLKLSFRSVKEKSLLGSITKLILNRRDKTAGHSYQLCKELTNIDQYREEYNPDFYSYYDNVGIIEGHTYCYSFVTVFSDGTESAPSQNTCVVFGEIPKTLLTMSYQDGKPKISWSLEKNDPHVTFKLLRADSTNLNPSCLLSDWYNVGAGFEGGAFNYCGSNKVIADTAQSPFVDEDAVLNQHSYRYTLESTKGDLIHKDNLYMNEYDPVISSKNSEQQYILSLGATLNFDLGMVKDYLVQKIQDGNPSLLSDMQCVSKYLKCSGAGSNQTCNETNYSPRVSCSQNECTISQFKKNEHGETRYASLSCDDSAVEQNHRYCYSTTPSFSLPDGKIVKGVTKKSCYTPGKEAPNLQVN